MIDLEWCNAFNIGYQPIDDDHKRLLDAMKRLRDALVENDLDQGRVLAQQVLETAGGHFRFEEGFLAEIKYPDLAQHEAYHQELLTRALEIKKHCENAGHPDDVQSCFDAMARFLVDDVIAGDLRFKSYLEHCGYISRY